MVSDGLSNGGHWFYGVVKEGELRWVDAQTGERRHQMLDGADANLALRTVALKARTHPRIADDKRARRQVDDRIEIDAAENDPRVRRRRTQHHRDLDPRMQADAGGTDQRLERALFEHVIDYFGNRRIVTQSANALCRDNKSLLGSDRPV